MLLPRIMHPPSRAVEGEGEVGEDESGTTRMRESSATRLHELDPPPRAIKGEGERWAGEEQGSGIHF